MTRAYADCPVVVLGGLGPLGAAAARRLVDLGARMTVVDEMSATGGANLGLLEGYEQRIDLRLVDPDSIGQLREVVRSAQVVLHVPPPLASNQWGGGAGREEGIRLTAVALLETVRTTNRGCRAVLASTRRVYGAPPAVPVSENTPCWPLSLPAVERLAAEATYTAFAETFDLAVAILRLTTVYGLGGDHAGASLPDRFLSRAKAGEPIIVYEADEGADDYLYLDDAVNALIAAGASPEVRGAVLNVGAGRAWVPREVAEAAVAAAGCGRVDVRQGAPPVVRSDARPFVADATRARALLNLAEAIPLAEGLRRAAGRT